MSSLGGFLTLIASCLLSCQTVSIKTAESETDARPRSARAGRAMWGPGRLIFHLKTGRLGDYRISVSPLAPVPYSRGKHCLHRSRGIWGGLCSLLPVFVARNHSSRTSGGVGALWQKAPAFSSPSSDSSAPLHASEPQLPFVICGIPCNDNALIQPTLFFVVSLFTYFTSSAEKEENTRETRSFRVCVCVCVALGGGSDGSPGESSVGSPGSHRGK